MAFQFTNSVIDESIDSALGRPGAPIDSSVDTGVGVGTDPFAVNRVTSDFTGTPNVGVSPSKSDITFGAPISASERSTNKPSLGIDSNKFDVPTMLGTLAHAFDPEGFGGRLGKGVIDIQAAEAKAADVGVGRALEERRVTTGEKTAEASKRSAEALTDFRILSEGRAQEEAKAKSEEVKRVKQLSSDVAMLGSLIDRDGKPMVGAQIYDDTLTKIKQGATPAELAQLVSSGIVPGKPKASKFLEVELPGSPGEFGMIDTTTNQFVKGPDGNVLRAATPGQLVPRFQALTTGTADEPVVATIQTTGVGAGPESIIQTGVGVPRKGKEKSALEKIIEKKLAETEKKKGATPVGVSGEGGGNVGVQTRTDGKIVVIDNRPGSPTKGRRGAMTPEQFEAEIKKSAGSFTKAK